MLHALYELLTTFDDRIAFHHTDVEKKLIRLAHVLLYGRFSADEFPTAPFVLAEECRQRMATESEEDA